MKKAKKLHVGTAMSGKPAGLIRQNHHNLVSVRRRHIERYFFIHSFRRWFAFYRERSTHVVNCSTSVILQYFIYFKFFFHLFYYNCKKRRGISWKTYSRWMTPCPKTPLSISTDFVRKLSNKAYFKQHHVLKQFRIWW